MNDEIKEILRIAKECHFIDISFEESDLLLDYITNLQQENERLKEWKEDLLKENIELENIRKETIEYIKDFRTEDYILVGKNSLLNILQNGGEKE